MCCCCTILMSTEERPVGDAAGGAFVLDYLFDSNKFARAVAVDVAAICQHTVR